MKKNVKVSLLTIVGLGLILSFQNCGRHSDSQAPTSTRVTKVNLVDPQSSGYKVVDGNCDDSRCLITMERVRRGNIPTEQAGGGQVQERDYYPYWQKNGSAVVNERDYYPYFVRCYILKSDVQITLSCPLKARVSKGIYFSKDS